MNLRNQRRMAAQLLKVGENKVKFNPGRIEDVETALTRDDIRYLISSGAITHKPKKGISRGRARIQAAKKKTGKRKGQGSRKGSSKTRSGGKKKWVSKIRAIRDELKKMREEEVIDATLYRKLYSQAKGNLFHSRRHLREYVERMVK